MPTTRSRARRAMSVEDATTIYVEACKASLRAWNAYMTGKITEQRRAEVSVDLWAAENAFREAIRASVANEAAK